jgi:hypothetical protein
VEIHDILNEAGVSGGLLQYLKGNDQNQAAPYGLLYQSPLLNPSLTGDAYPGQFNLPGFLNSSDFGAGAQPFMPAPAGPPPAVPGARACRSAVRHLSVAFEPAGPVRSDSLGLWLDGH